MRVLLLIAAVVAVSALPPFVDDSLRTVIQNRRSAPQQWQLIGEADGATRMSFVIGLKQVGVCAVCVCLCCAVLCVCMP